MEDDPWMKEWMSLEHAAEAERACESDDVWVFIYAAHQCYRLYCRSFVPQIMITNGYKIKHLIHKSLEKMKLWMH